MASIDPVLAGEAPHRAAPSGFREALQPRTILAATGWFAAAAVLLLWPDITYQPLVRELASIWTAVGGALVLLGLAGNRLGRVGRWVSLRAPWLFVIGAGSALWTVLTAKTGILPQPFFPTP